METLLEQQRRYHEERERLMDGMVQVCLFNNVGILWYHLNITIFRDTFSIKLIKNQVSL